MILKPIAVAAGLLCTGCYYGAMQGARTLGEDNLVFSGNLMMPAFFSSSDRQEAEESREDYLETWPNASFMMGATGNIDLGFTAMAYGIGPMVKYAFTPGSSDNAISLLAGINYVIPMQVVMPHGSLAAGHMVGDRLEVYGAADGGYGPDLANIPDDGSGGHDWDEGDNTFFSDLRAGCVYTIQPEGGTRHYGAFVPAAIVFEFAFPLDLSRNMIIAGLGVMY